MARKKKQKANKKPPVSKANLQELQETRDGGQIALRGYSYQFLYSCNLILSSDTDTVFTLEGIEDIDRIDGMVKGIEPNVSADILTTVNKLCSAVYHGDSFGDKKYNELISYVQTAST